MEHIGRELHHDHRPAALEQGLRALEHIEFVAVDVHLDQLDVGIARGRDRGVEGGGQSTRDLHGPAPHLRVIRGASVDRPARGHRGVDGRPGLPDQERLMEFDPFGQSGVREQIGPQLRDREVGGLEGDHPALLPDEAGQVEGVGADVRADVEDGGAASHQGFEGPQGVSLERAQGEDGEIDALAQVEAPVDPVPLRQDLVAPPEKPARRMEDEIQHPRDPDLGGRAQHRRVSFEYPGSKVNLTLSSIS